MPDDNWYYTMGGQQQGPAPLEHLKHWLKNGQLQPTEMVWREGMPTWIAANTVPELQASLGGGYPAGAVGGAAAAGFQPTINYAQPAGYQPVDQGGYAHAAAIKSQKSKATTSLVTGILGMICLGLIGIVLPIIAIVSAINAFNEMKRTQSDEGKGMAVAGLVLGILSIVVRIGLMAVAVSR